MILEYDVKFIFEIIQAGRSTTLLKADNWRHVKPQMAISDPEKVSFPCQMMQAINFQEKQLFFAEHD